MISWGLIASCLAASLPASSEGIQILNHAQELLNNRQIEEARALLSQPRLQAIRKSDPLIDAAVLNDLGLIFKKGEMFRDAEEAFNQAIGLLRHTEGDDTPALVDPLANLANLFYQCSQFSRAERLLLREIAILDVPASGERDQRSVFALTALAKVYLSEHKYELAQGTAEKLIKAGGDADETLRLSAALGYSVLGSVSTLQGRLPAAEESLRAALSILESALGPDDVRISEALANLGLVYAQSRDMGVAEALLKDAYVRLSASRGNDLFRQGFLLRYSEAERRFGNKKKARELLNEARWVAARNPANVLSRYIVDASAYRP